MQPSLKELVARWGEGALFASLFYIAAKLSIDNALSDGPKTVDELAQQVGANPRVLRRILRALVMLDAFCEDADGRFSVGRLGEELRNMGNLERLALIEWGEAVSPSRDALLHSVKTGEPAFDHAHGMGVWEYRERHAELGRLFEERMTQTNASIEGAVDEICKNYDFTHIKRIVDVGGGQGFILRGLLKRHAHLNGVLFDQATTIESAREMTAKEGLLSRCELRAGNFFESIPSGADLYLLKAIIHDWNDEEAVRILKRCREAMAKSGRLLLVESIMPTRLTPLDPRSQQSLARDLGMLLMEHGMERTKEEYAALFEAAGLRLNNVIPIPRFHVELLEGVPV